MSEYKRFKYTVVIDFPTEHPMFDETESNLDNLFKTKIEEFLKSIFKKINNIATVVSSDKKITPTVPRVIMFIEGGVVHDVMSDAPVELRVIDYDTDGCDNVSNIRLVVEDGKTLSKNKHACHVLKYSLKGVEDVEPFFKQKSIK
jgi:ABC-type polysaccharide/polyol phosphate transport system ATPase subunit